MGYYKVSFDALESTSNAIKQQMNTALARLVDVHSALLTMINSDSMEGKTAEAIKTYLTEVHDKIVVGMMTLVKAHSDNFLVYKNVYSYCDIALHFVIHTEELQNICTDLKSNGNNISNCYYNAKTALASVQDLLFVSVANSQNTRSGVIRIEKALSELIEKVENSHFSADFSATGPLCYDLRSAIRSLRPKGTGADAFDTVDYSKTKALADAVSALAAEQQNKSEAIKQAEERERDYQLQAEQGGETVSEDDSNIGDEADWISHLIGLISKKADDDSIGAIGDAFGLVSSLYDLITGDKSAVDKISKSLTDVSKDLTGLFEDVLADSDADISSTLGITSAILSVASQMIASIGKTPEDFLRDSGDLIAKGAKLAEKLYKECLADADFDAEAAEKDVAAIASLFSMITRAVGDVISYSEDGTYDLNDYADTLLETGLAGASTLIKLFTLDLISIDVDDTADVFRANEDSAVELIRSWGLPAWVEVVVTIAASPIVTIKSLYDTAAGNETVKAVVSGAKIGISTAGDVISDFFSGDPDPVDEINEELRNTTVINAEYAGDVVIF